jgi:hypothetical protein
MCGLAGFAGVQADEYAKLMLVFELAIGIDLRGGDAAGYVSLSEKEGLKYAKRVGTWVHAKPRFFESAASGEMCMMHARFATCGSKGYNDAHPFAIRRNGKVVLWGAHNGMIPDAWDSAKKHKRDCNVDSKELFELLADKNYAGIQDMTGYGVITWIEAENPTHVKMARLTEDSDIVVVALKEGGIVWGSTMSIVQSAVESAELNIRCVYTLNDIGRVYQMQSDGVYQTACTDVKLAEYFKWSGWSNNSYYKYMEQYQKSCDDDNWENWGSYSDLKESREAREKAQLEKDKEKALASESKDDDSKEDSSKEDSSKDDSIALDEELSRFLTRGQ